MSTARPTGRPRRVGPVDLVASRYGVSCQGCDEVALTLLDVLDYMEKVPVITAYALEDGSTTTRFPMGKALDTAKPVVEYLPGWHCDITAARHWEDLPRRGPELHPLPGKGRGLQDHLYLGGAPSGRLTSTGPKTHCRAQQNGGRIPCLIS